MVSTLVNKQRNVLDNEEIRELSTAFSIAETVPPTAFNFLKQEFRGKYLTLIFNAFFSSGTLMNGI